MREILFRGKRKDNGEWVEGWLLGNPNRSGGIFIVTYYQFALDKKTGTKYEIPPKSLEYYEVLPETVGQFTDVIDKNGVKIFEGDRIKVFWLAELGITEFNCQTIGTVKYLTELGETAGFYVVFDELFVRKVLDEDGYYEEEKQPIVAFNEDLTISYEVIGNIHEEAK
jgi:uncharacterized phage protein (TIGR01671 family)